MYEKLNSQPVGIILEEHRRCEQTIATFSNRYVYNDKFIIVNKDNYEKLFDTNLLAIDVREKDRNENVNYQEAFICKKIVQKLVDRHGEKVKKILVLLHHSVIKRVILKAK